jgi:regulator of sirC expression with transglutaminase-like and TPR domain
MDQAEINALIDLLDDPDQEVFNNIRDRLISYGKEVIPELENAWEASFNNVVQTRIEEIIHNIQFTNIRTKLALWADKLDPNLLEGALLVAKYQYPDLDEERMLNKIEVIKRDIWLELNANLTALEKVRVMNHIIFEIHGYSGNTTNYHAPQNSYINNVLESKKGNPLSLSILYSVIAQSLGLPIYGVNLPEHFILAYKDVEGIADEIMRTDNTHGVLFYINAFSKGSVFGKREIDTFLKQINMKPIDMFYTPCSNVDIIVRMLRNLMGAYEKLGYPEKVKDLEELLIAITSGNSDIV